LLQFVKQVRESGLQAGQLDKFVIMHDKGCDRDGERYYLLLFFCLKPPCPFQILLEVMCQGAYKATIATFPLQTEFPIVLTFHKVFKDMLKREVALTGSGLVVYVFKYDLPSGQFSTGHGTYASQSIVCSG